MNEPDGRKMTPCRDPQGEGEVLNLSTDSLYILHFFCHGFLCRMK